jgi:hypothetical protein
VISIYRFLTVRLLVFLDGDLFLPPESIARAMALSRALATQYFTQRAGLLRLLPDLDLDLDFIVLGLDLDLDLDLLLDDRFGGILFTRSR